MSDISSNDNIQKASLSELKACPFCGGEAHKNIYVHCKRHTSVMRDDDWNTRPIEDALRAEVDTLKRMNGLESGVTILAMGKPVAYWLNLEKQLEIAVEGLKYYASGIDCGSPRIAINALAEIENVANSSIKPNNMHTGG